MKNEHGTTLIEVIAALAISSLILIITFSLIHQSQNEHKTQLKNNETLTKNSYILKQISLDIRESILIDNYSSTNEVTLIKKDNSKILYKFEIP